MIGEYKLNEIYNKDSLEFLKERADYEFDINYSDPPYALGSEVIIRPDGKVDYKKANDFMNKWEMPTGEYWEQWFKEAYRTLKHGGYCIMFGMDRQLLLFKYYANLAGFEEQQSLYWYFISNFPKATDLSKQIDKNIKRVDMFEPFANHYKEQRSKNNMTHNQICEIGKFYENKNHGGASSNWELGLNVPTKEQWIILQPLLELSNEYLPLIERVEAEREVIGKQKGKITNISIPARENYDSGEFNITAPSTDLAKKYDGYKYSISPLKQTNETILIFRKPYKSGSCLHDTLAFENGDNECRCGALNIDGNRVGTESRVNQFAGNKNGYTLGDDRDEKGSGFWKQDNQGETETTGRYPSQTFCDEKTAEVLDKQSGKDKKGFYRPNVVDKQYNQESDINVGGGNVNNQYNDTGGCSKILHKCNFEKEDYDIYNYQPKVSKSERNAGCDGDEQQYSHDGRNKEIENPYQRNKSVAINNHPTLKPIALNEKILKLFKTPNDDKIVYPFAGSGSEVIGGIKAGFNNWVGCEINPDYVDIAKARIDYWTTQDEQLDIFDLIGSD